VKQEYIDTYGNFMEEIKLRTEAVYSILQKRFTTQYPATNIEFMCLQIRKILELIALGSLITDKDEYIRQNEKLAKQWRVGSILDGIEKINPDFYPLPGKQVIDPTTGKVQEVVRITTGYLTRTDFSGIYDDCSDAIHIGNLLDHTTDYASLEKNIPCWISKIVTLLDHHQIQLLNEKQQLWVIMKGKDDNRVHVHLMERRDP